MVRVQRKTNVSIRSLGAEWHLLAEILVAGEPDQKTLAIEQVLETVGIFQLTAQHMEKMKTAVTRAVMNEIELIGQERTLQPISIRVMASEQAVKAQTNPEAFKGHGWGYFLIEKMTEEAWLRGAVFCQKIELYLYLEGEI